MDAVVDIQEVTVAYGSHVAISGITVSLPGEQSIAIIGPNGSGKSTLVKAVLGLVPLKRGKVSIFGQPFNRVRNKVGYVPQKEEVDWNYPLLVGEVVAQGCCRPSNMLRPLNGQDLQIIESAVEKLGLSQLVRRPISQLSGGQRQRVFLARALARQAELYILDEPFNGVDAGTEEIVMGYIRDLKSEGKTVIIVHHKLDEVYASFDHALLLNKELVFSGPAREIFREDILFKAYGDMTIPGRRGWMRDGGQAEEKQCLIG